MLADLLPERVASVLSLNSLREDLSLAHDTVKMWIDALSSVYYCFLVSPWSRRISRTVRSEKKLYLFDFLAVEDDGRRLENLVALHLLKACQFWTDSAAGEFNLHFIRTRDGQEIDFLIVRDGRPWMLIEVKRGETNPTKSLIRFSQILQTTLNFQLVRKANVRKQFPDSKIEVLSVERFLAGLV